MSRPKDSPLPERTIAPLFWLLFGAGGEGFLGLVLVLFGVQLEIEEGRQIARHTTDFDAGSRVGCRPTGCNGLHVGDGRFVGKKDHRANRIVTFVYQEEELRAAYANGVAVLQSLAPFRIVQLQAAVLLARSLDC